MQIRKGGRIRGNKKWALFNKRLNADKQKELVIQTSEKGKTQSSKSNS